MIPTMPGLRSFARDLPANAVLGAAVLLALPAAILVHVLGRGVRLGRRPMD